MPFANSRKSWSNRPRSGIEAAAGSVCPIIHVMSSYTKETVGIGGVALLLMEGQNKGVGSPAEIIQAYRDEQP